MLKAGYTNITVLDISAAAIDRAKNRLGERASQVNWIVEDINRFVPTQSYDLLHDRAAFHFLTHSENIKRYVSTVNEALNPFGSLIIGTFSENGPIKCSGIEITQYSQQSMVRTFADSILFLTLKLPRIRQQ